VDLPVNKPIADDDPRVAAVGTLWADGRVVSHAAVLAPGVAVAPSFGAAQGDLLKIGRRGGPIRYGTLQVTARNPFAVLTYSDRVGRTRLGGGRMAMEAKLTFVAYDDKADHYFSAEGRIATTPTMAILLNPGFSILPSWTGAPAFDEGGLLVGMIGRGAGGPILLDILSLDEMFASSKELAGLLIPERSEQVPISGAPTGMQTGTPQRSVVGLAEQERELETQPTERASSVETPNPKLRDEELWARFSDTTKMVLGRADGLRRSARQSRVHMEHLIAALFDIPDGPAQRLFVAAKINRARLQQIIKETVGTEIPPAYGISELRRLPRMSQHVHEALDEAARVAEAGGLIRSRHLLYGALSISNCEVIDAVTRLGVNKNRIVLDEEPDVEESVPPIPEAEKKPRPEPTPPLPPRAPMAAPTPKVDSDLWCSEELGLGYEAYARTIASLITHKETVPPLTIGIKAPWGAGKTSLMKRVQHLLDGDASFTERNEAGLKQMWQQSAMTFWSLLKTLSRKTIIVDPEKHEPEEELGRRARELLKEAVKVDALKPKESVEGRRYGISPRITIWFNAWKFQTSEQVWAGMAQCIIDQVTARMDTKQRELFWLRLRARRINADEVRWRVWEAVLRQVLPFALLTATICILLAGVVLIVSALLPVFPVFPKLPYYIVRTIPFLGILAVAWKTGTKLGDKAAGSVRALVREPRYEDKMGYLTHVESDMRDVLKLASVTSKQPLVVFVDDLDRCAPNKVAEVVEAINLFLCGDYPNCIFVLGMEPGMVAAALEVANKEVIQKAKEEGLVDAVAPVGWRFMEKIVQLPIMIPPPTEAGRRGYVSSLAGLPPASIDMNFTVTAKAPFVPIPIPVPRPAQHGEDEEAKVQNYIEKIGSVSTAAEAAKKGEAALERAPVEERWAVREASNRVYERSLTERDPAIAKFAEEVAQLVEANPRQIKRYVNVFRFYTTLRYRLQLEGVVPRENFPSDGALAKFVALGIRWPHAMDCLRIRVMDENGGRTSLLRHLETVSRDLPKQAEAASDAWKKLVGKDGLGLPEWAQERAFREFLADGEMITGKEDHGVW
jgi:hypothetical protein